MEFMGRESELSLLEDHLHRPGPGLFVLYGRRRIGKTALLSRALEGLPRAAYHVGTRSTITEELGRLSATLSRAWDLPLLAAQPLDSATALIALLEGLQQPAILALDEFPYLVESEASLPGLLQASWDRRLSQGRLKLVVCGSSVSVMERTFLSQRSPLFGRRTGQLMLGPLAPHQLARAFPWSAPEVIELAALFGGVPGYLGRLDPERDLRDNLLCRVLRRGEPLYEEIPFLLREELREPRVYQAILAVIASGARKFGEISSKVGLDRANLTRYLATLADLGLVEREVPVTEPRPDKSRKGYYRITDPFVATWFGLVHPRRDAIERGSAGEALARDLWPEVRRRLPQAVEPVFSELVRAPCLAGTVPFVPAFAGRHWSPATELDLVALDESREQALVAEIKWSARPVEMNLLDDLRRRVAREPAFDDLCCTYALISRSGVRGARPPRDDERVIDVRRLAL